jgi:hypothetical protein
MAIESAGPVDPPFNVRFQTEMFDFGCSQGLCCVIGDKTPERKRRAIPIRHDDPPSKVSAGLRALADWLDEQSKPG